MCLRYASYVSIVAHEELIRIGRLCCILNHPILMRRDQTCSMLCLINYEKCSSIKDPCYKKCWYFIVS